MGYQPRLHLAERPPCSFGAWGLRNTLVLCELVGVLDRDGPKLPYPLGELAAPSAIDELCLRGYSKHTIRAYVHAVRLIAKRFRRSPDEVSFEELRTLLLERCRADAAASTLNLNGAKSRILNLRGMPEIPCIGSRCGIGTLV